MLPLVSCYPCPGYTDTGARITIKDSTLVLTDADYQLEYVQAVNNMLDLT